MTQIRRLSRRQFLGYSAGGLAALALGACGRGNVPGGRSSGSSAASGIQGQPVEGTIHIDTYEEWIGPETFDAFGAKYPDTSIVPEYSYSPGDRIAKYLAGGSQADIMLMELSWLPALSDQGEVARLDLSAIPNYELIDPRYKVGPFSDAEALGVAVDSGRYGIAYRRDLVSEPIDSWGDFFEVASRYPGKFALEDYSPFGIAAALVALGRPINSTDPADIGAAQEFLISKKEVLGPLWGNSPVRPLINGEYYASSMWDLLGPLAIGRKKDIRWVFPSDGIQSWIEGWIAMSASPVLPAVHALMDFTLIPEYYADFVNLTGVSNLMPTATDLVDPWITESEILNPSADVVERTVPTEYLGSAQRLYDDAWSAFKAA